MGPETHTIKIYLLSSAYIFPNTPASVDIMTDYAGDATNTVTKATATEVVASAISLTVSALNPFKTKEKPPKAAQKPGAVKSEDNSDEWTEVDIFEIEAYEQYMENQAGPGNLNIVRDTPQRVNYPKECWEVLKVIFSGGKNRSFRQIGW